MADERPTHRGSVDYEQVGSDYMEKRELKKGAAGWVLLAGLGVAYVISGDFAGWNFGLAEGGWGGLLIATILMATMYTCMVFALAELSSTISTAGGGYGFGRRALGPWGGFLTGTAILIEYALAPAAIVTFIGAYVEALDIGISAGWPVYLVFYAIFVGIHLVGVGEALKVTFVITAIAVVALLVFVVAIIPEFSASNLTDIPPDGSSGSSDFLPFGWDGIWAAFPYAIWFFLAIEGVPLAAEETRDPKKDMPRGLIAGMGVLLVFAALMLFFAPGGSGSEAIMGSGNPPVDALIAVDAGSGVTDFVNWVGLFGLIASFFSIIFAYSRQLFALSRAGYFPRALSVTSGRKVPWIALVLPALVGFLMAAFWEDQGARILNIAVFGAAVSYVLMMLSHIVLRSREPDLERGYTHAGRHEDLGRGARARGARGGRDLPGRHHGGVHHARRLCRGGRVLRALLAAPPRRRGAGGGVRGDRERRGRARGSLMTLDELRKAVDEGTVDTVLLVFADMQGRLQGKRLVGSHFVHDVIENGAEACNYLLAVDVDMNTVPGYAMSSWETGYGDFEMKPDFDDAAAGQLDPGNRDVHGRPALARPLAGGRLAAADPEGAARPARPSAAGTPWRPPSSSSSSSATPTRRRSTRPTATSSPATSTTSTTRSSAPRGWSRCWAASGARWRPRTCRSRTPRASATSASTRSTSATPTR